MSQSPHNRLCGCEICERERREAEIAEEDRRASGATTFSRITDWDREQAEADEVRE